MKKTFNFLYEMLALEDICIIHYLLFATILIQFGFSFALFNREGKIFEWIELTSILIASFFVVVYFIATKKEHNIKVNMVALKDAFTNLNQIIDGKHIIGTELSVIVEYVTNWEKLGKQGYGTYLCKTHNNNWLNVTIAVYRGKIDNILIESVDNKYVRKQLSHNIELYSKYFGVPEVA